MRSVDPERVVRKLIIVKGVLVIGGRPDTTLISAITSADIHDWGCLPRSAAQRQICRRGIDGAAGYEVKRMTAAVTDSCGIHHGGSKGMVLFDYHGLPASMRFEDYVVEAVRLGEVGGI